MTFYLGKPIEHSGEFFKRRDFAIWKIEIGSDVDFSDHL